MITASPDSRSGQLGFAEGAIHGRDAIRRTETSSLDCLHRIGQDYLDLLDRNSDDLKVWFFKAVCEDGDRETRDFLAESYRSYARYLEDVARPGQERGEIRRDIPARVVARQMMSLGATFNLFAVLGLSETGFVFVEKLSLTMAGKINKVALQRELATG